jgi:hypothetical protein
MSRRLKNRLASIARRANLTDRCTDTLVNGSILTYFRQCLTNLAQRALTAADSLGQSSQTL